MYTCNSFGHPPKYGHLRELVTFTGFSVYSFKQSITITICSKKELIHMICY